MLLSTPEAGPPSSFFLPGIHRVNSLFTLFRLVLLVPGKKHGQRFHSFKSHPKFPFQSHGAAHGPSLFKSGWKYTPVQPLLSPGTSLPPHLALRLSSIHNCSISVSLQPACRIPSKLQLLVSLWTPRLSIPSLDGCLAFRRAHLP